MKKVSFILMFLFCIIVFAQYFPFGKNKVNYKNKKWKITKTKHFDIYYYDSAENLASFVSVIAENSIKSIEYKFNYKMKNRIPIIIYNSHKDFEETNIINEIVNEFVGGFTEFLKNRVVLPFEGSYADFRHVINHELIHAFQMDYFYGSSNASAALRASMYNIPLWFVEGSAEFYSREWDRETDMYMRDAIINDNYVKLRDLSYYYGGYIIYKEGQAFLKYISDIYGEEKIVELYKNIKLTKSFIKAINKTFGLNIEELDKQFKFYLKKRYAPSLLTMDQKIPNSISLLGDFIKTSPYNVSASLSPDGNYVAFISERNGFFDIYFLQTNAPSKKNRLFPRQITRHYESFHLKQGQLNWSFDSKYLLFAVREGYKEKIIVYDIINRKIHKKIDFDFDMVFSPSMSRDNNSIVFSAVKDGKTDIVIYSIDNDNYNFITDDIYDDINPKFLNDSLILFSSSRGIDSLWDYDIYNLFLYNIKTHNIKKITNGQFGSIKLFSILSDSQIVFEGNMGMGKNAFLLDLNNNTLEQLTNIITGFLNPSISSNGNLMVGILFEDFKYDIIKITNPLNNAIKVNSDTLKNDYKRIFTKYDFPNIKYTTPSLNFSFDWIVGAAAYSPGYGLWGILDMAVSDILGNHQFYLQIQKLSLIGDGYVIAQYWYLKNRIDYAFQYLNYQQTYYGYNYSVSYAYNGGGLLFRFPIDRFNRFDFEINLFEYKQIERIVNGNYIYSYIYKTWINDFQLSFVHDNSIWGYFGPINGNVARFDIGVLTFSLFDNLPDIKNSFQYGYTYINTDIRKYQVLTSRSQLALRLAGSTHIGGIYQPVFIGGTGTIRGYNNYQFYGLNAYFTNIELRFPLIDIIQFPIPGLFISNIRGVAFTDMGFAKDKLTDLSLFTNNFSQLNDLKMGIGVGIRMYIWLAILKLDVAKNTDLRTLSKEYYWHLDFGAEF